MVTLLVFSPNALFEIMTRPKLHEGPLERITLNNRVAEEKYQRPRASTLPITQKAIAHFYYRMNTYKEGIRFFRLVEESLAQLSASQIGVHN